MLAILEKVVSGRKKRQAERAADYAALVRQIGDGQEPTAEDVDFVLEATNKSPEDLAADVVRYEKRLQLRQQLDEIPGMERRQAEISTAIEKENEKWQTLCEAHDAVIVPLASEALILKSKIMAANACKDKLFHGCTDAAILAERAEIERDRAAKNRMIFDREDSVTQHQRAADEMFRSNRGKYKDFDGDIEKLQKQIREKRAEIEGLQAEVAALSRRDRELEEQMLNP